MAVIAGIMAFGQDTPSAHIVAHLAGGVKAVRNQEFQIHRRGPVVMLASRLADSCEDGFAREPCHDDGVCVVFDGRLDNRAELLCRYEPLCDVNSTDSELACAFLARAGVSGLKRLTGEWSLALWHPAENQLWLASDLFGTRPLYSRRLKTALCWSSDIESLLGLEPDTLDEDYLIGELTLGGEPNRTPYRDISSVPSGHHMVVTPAGRVNLVEHADLRYATRTYSDDSEYIEEMRRLLNEAVAVRLRPRAPAWIMLSGGYDSSAIYCLADRLVTAGLVRAPSIRSVNVTSRASAEGDESRFTRAATEGRPWPAHQLDVAEYIGRHFTRASPYPVDGYLIELQRRMELDGTAVLLSGRLGDAVMAYYPDYSYSLATHLAKLQLLRFFIGAHEWAHGVRHTFWQMCLHGASMMLPARSQERTSRRRMLAKRASQPTDSRRLVDVFCLQDHLQERVEGMTSGIEHIVCRWPDPGRRFVLHALYHYRQLRLLQSPASTPRLRYSYPFAHRPLVEFALSVPHDVLCRPGVPRAAMKAALRDIVPDKILNRIGKSYAVPSAVRQFRDRAVDLKNRVHDLRIVSLGLVDPLKLRKKLERLLAGSTTDVSNLLTIGDIEEWLCVLDAPMSRSHASHASFSGERIYT